MPWTHPVFGRLRLRMATWIAAVSLLALVPMLLFAALVVQRQIAAQQEQGMAALQRRAAVAAAAVGNELDSVFAGLNAMLQTETVLRGDLAGLHALSMRVVASDPRIASISVVSIAGEMPFTTSRPFGSRLPPSNAVELQRPVFEHGATRLVSPLVIGAVSGQPVVAAVVPLELGNQGRFALRAVMRLPAIADWLNEQDWPADLTAAVVDQNNVIIARSRDADRFVGQPATQTLQDGFRSGRKVFRAVTKDGQESVVSAVRVPGSNWYVAVASPSSALNAQVRDSMVSILLAGVGCALLGIGGALFLSRQLGRQLRLVVETQLRGDRGSGSRFAIREVAQLADALTEARVTASHASSALQVAREDALARLTERSEMLDVLAHEVRQPLNNASAALQAAAAALSRRGERAVDDPLRRAEAVLSDVQASIDNTLAVASLLVIGQQVQREDTDIDALIGVVIADMPSAEAGRVRVERATATRTASMESSLMRLALRNLLSNALKYSPRDAPVIVRVSDSDAPLALIIDVVDAGAGIDPALLAHLFDRGARRPQAVGARRQGLGLFIVRRVMELHGGSVCLERNDRSGTTMRLVIDQGRED